MKAITRAQNGTGATSDQALHWIGTCPAPEVGTSLDDILSMRVGCWRPPVYVKHSSRCSRSGDADRGGDRPRIGKEEEDQGDTRGYLLSPFRDAGESD